MIDVYKLPLISFESNWRVQSRTENEQRVNILMQV